MESKIVEIKRGTKWEESCRTEDKAEIYDSLAHDLISKKLCGCSWISGIKRIQLYTGFLKIVVSYANGTRAIYTIRDKEHP